MSDTRKQTCWTVTFIITIVGAVGWLWAIIATLAPGETMNDVNPGVWYGILALLLVSCLAAKMESRLRDEQAMKKFFRSFCR